MILNQGKTILLNQVATKLVNGGVGINSTSADATDTGLFGGGTTIDEMDASNSTNWAESGDAVNPSDLTSSGQFQHGSGCMGIGWTNSSGTAAYERTVSSTDLTDNIAYVWFYIADKSALVDTTNAIRIDAGSSSTDVVYWNYSYDSLVSGWNSLKMDLSSVTGSSGSPDIAAITYFKITFQESATVSVGSARLDYLRYYTPNTLGVTEAIAALSQSTGDFYIKTTHSVDATYANGLDIVEVGDADGTTLISRVAIPAVTKGSSTTLQVDKFYYWE